MKVLQLDGNLKDLAASGCCPDPLRLGGMA